MKTLYMHLLLAAVVMAGCKPSLTGPLQVTGQIEGEAVTAGSKVGGRVMEVLAQEGDKVKTGEVIIRLDDADNKALLAAAEAQLAAMEAQLAKAEVGATPEQLQQAEALAQASEQRYQMAEKGARSEEIRAARAALDAAAAQMEVMQSDYNRAKKLHDDGAASARQFDQAQGAFDTAAAQHRAAKERYDMLVKGLRDEEVGAAKAMYDQASAALAEVKRGTRAEDLAAARAARDAAAADRQRAEVALREMTISAPIDGVIESLDVHPGDIIKPGPIVRLINPEDLKIIVYVGAGMLGHLQIGQKIPLTTDAHGTETFEGTIARIASEGEFTPRNLQTQEERIQQVFGVKLVLNSAGGKLRAGMTATAHLPKPTVAGK